MQAAIACTYGGLDCIAVCEGEALPIPGDSEVLIRVAFASINPVDWKMLSGYLSLIESGGTAKRRIRGFDASGEIVALGKNCIRVNMGDRVMCMLHFSQVAQGRGTFAELVAVDEKYDIAIARRMILISIVQICVEAAARLHGAASGRTPSLFSDFLSRFENVCINASRPDCRHYRRFLR